MALFERDWRHTAEISDWIKGRVGLLKKLSFFRA
jgi:hypothetical protein